jgi:cyclopropane-fatty-acyl-phospholipid synthase
LEGFRATLGFAASELAKSGLEANPRRDGRSSDGERSTPQHGGFNSSFGGAYPVFTTICRFAKKVLMGSDAARDLCFELLARADVSVNGPEPDSMQVHNDRLWERLVRERELGLGEAYMDGWWSCDQIDELLTKVLVSDARAGLKPTPMLAAHIARSTVLNLQSKRKAAANARAHYDIGNDLYEAMLDKRMVYSCGYWCDAGDLDSAQEAKLDLVCRKLQLEPGMSLLDIGCGWGGLVQYAAERHGVRAVGVSPALEQVRLARERTAGLPVEIRQAEYRELTGTFDRIVSVGMMEHVGPRNLATFFSTCDELLASGGMMLHHTIGSTLSKTFLDPFFDRYIFPGAVLPSLAQIARAVESNFVIEDVHNFGPDYDRTLMAWHANIESAWPRIGDRYDERFRRMWRYYLLSSAAGFRSRNLQLWQIVFRREGRATRYESVR